MITDKELQEYLESFRKFKEEVTATKETATKFLRELGVFSEQWIKNNISDEENIQTRP